MLSTLKFARSLGRHGRAILAGLSIYFMAGTVEAADIKMESLTAGGETYHKVTIMSKTATDLFITHSAGFANIKVEELDAPTRVKLGYQAPRAAGASGQVGSPIDLSQFGGLGKVSEDEQVQEAQAKLQAFFEEKLGGVSKKHLLMGVVGVLASIYFFMCFCLHSLCKKTGNNPGIVVWLPILQMFPVLKAAGMASWWFFVYVATVIVPFAAVPLMRSMGPSPVLLVLMLPFLLSVVGWIVWCFKICAARGVSPVFGVMLLAPFISNLILVGLSLGGGGQGAVLNIPPAFFAAPPIIFLLSFLYLSFGSPNPNVALQPGGAKTARWAKSRAQDTSFFMQG